MFSKNFNSMLFPIILLTIISCERVKKSHFELPKLFSDGMVLQRNTLVTITGKYIPNQKINISCSWVFDTTTFSDANGNWRTHLKTNSASNAQTITLSSDNDIYEINDILLGEVWIAAGQSNMEMTFDYCCNSTDSSDIEIKSANFNKIRMYNVKKSLSRKPLNDTEGEWISAIGKNIIDFSAAGYFFAKKLHLSLDVPIGIIHSSWGGSNIQSWTNKNVLIELDGYKEKYEAIQKDSLLYKETKEWYSRFDNFRSGASVWDLILFSDILPEIGYFDYSVAKWSEIDILGLDDINQPLKNSKNWKTINSKDVKNLFLNNPSFSGAYLFRNSFKVDIKDTVSYKIIIEPNESAKSKFWEYDIYLNKKRIASTLFGLKEDEYSFDKQKKSYQIKNDIIKNKKINTIMVRVLGYGDLGKIKVIQSGNNISFSDDWEVKILAEEAFQLSNFNPPYTAFYDYSKIDINYSEIPKNKIFLNHNTPSAVYNGMLHPLLNYTIKGFIWYQGESNVGYSEEYKEIFTMMINDIRLSYGNKMPFYYAQLAKFFNYGGKLSVFQQMQTELLKIKNTGMIITSDIGENYDIHPSNKHDVGNRFALLALNRTYGHNLIDSGPMVSGIDFEGRYANVYFKHSGNGLKIIDHKRSGFEIAGENKIYYESNVDIYKNFLQLNSNYVQNPKYVRYAWGDTAKVTLFNSEGLPASPFSYEYISALNQ